jgi:predicted DNA-binding transcriptional regulator YafY
MSKKIRQSTRAKAVTPADLNKSKKLEQNDKLYDRGARLQFLTHQLIRAWPGGASAAELAEKCEVCTKTIYRDIITLEIRLKATIGQVGHKYFIEPGTYLPPVRFTLPEAVALFLSARLLATNSNAYNPVIIEAFQKLNTVIPGPVGLQVRKSFEWLQKQPQDDKYIDVMNKLSNAWAEGQTVKIRYKSLGRKPAADRDVDPYFIQPAALEHANYLIAYCHKEKDVRIFKVERIEWATVYTNKKYTIPASFDINKYLGSSWGISVYGDVEDVEIKFTDDLSTIAKETRWHPSQVNVAQKDGSVIAKFKIQVSPPFIGFILSWGAKAEVIKPVSLRKAVLQEATAISGLY